MGEALLEASRARRTRGRGERAMKIVRGGGRNVTRAEATAIDELSERVLRIIGAYEMGGPIGARDRCPITAREEASPEVVDARDEGYVLDGVYHVAR
jgi:hypothetical protein